jgi:hypothetical protein
LSEQCFYLALKLQYKFIEAQNIGIFCFVVNYLKLILGGGGRGLAVTTIVCTKYT